MSRCDDRASLMDKPNHAREVVAPLGSAGWEDLAANRVPQLALARFVEIIGESANRVTDDVRRKQTEIPWADIDGLRNRLVHGYDVIDYDVLRDTATADLPPLILSRTLIRG